VDWEIDWETYDLIIAKAWEDEDFKRKLLDYTTETLKAEGFPIPDGEEIKMVENTGTLLNVPLVEGLVKARSKVPRSAFGKVIVKALEDNDFRRNLIDNTAETLKAEGVTVPGDIEVVMLEETDTLRYWVYHTPDHEVRNLSELYDAELDPGMLDVKNIKRDALCWMANEFY